MLLNAVPLYGVLRLGWQSFDVIFLYWIENLLIGFFALLRIVVRPYRHPLELVLQLLLAPFFTFHYGMFCWVHGSFVISLFGPASLRSAALEDAMFAALQTPFVSWSVSALLMLRLLDWIGDVRLHGLGGEGVKALMFGPYRRIFVLHLTIILSGFALGALDEPTVGLVLLVVLKTAFDVHLRRAADRHTLQGESPELSPGDFEELARQYPRPMVTVDGEEIVYGSFAELRDSRHYRFMGAMLRLMGAGKALRKMDAYMRYRIREEQADEASSRSS